MTLHEELHAAAHELTNAGMAVLPVRADGSKAPAIAWKDRGLAHPDEIEAWFGHQGGGTPSFDGLGVITGTPSGRLELLEVEGRALDLVPTLTRLMDEAGYTELWQRLCAGWLERSPSGGLHWHYRILPSEDDAQLTLGNRKLARRPNTENPKLVDVLVETRGEGGFVVTAPSAGRTHPTGTPWTLIAGGPAKVPEITYDERDTLHAIAAQLDAMPSRELEKVAENLGGDPPARTYDPADGLRPGDDYNERTSWDDILVPHGWTKVKQLAGGYAWTRPGKKARDGISATTGTSSDGADRLFVFTTSTSFEDLRPYSKFAAYAHLEHGDDYADAAKALRDQGYGSERSRPTGNILDLIGGNPPDPGTPDARGTEGNLATMTRFPTPRLTVVEERTLTHSDDANGLALVERYGETLRHCADRGRWYAWDGTVWAPCPRTAGIAREYAKRVARTLPERDTRDISFKKKSLSAPGISAMLTQAASDERVAVDYHELDAHPWELNTPGGIVDLRTGHLTAPDPAKLHTRLTAWAPDPEADQSMWLKFLDTTFGGDPELIAFMQRLVGYSAIGMVGAHVLPYCYGSGGNGKGAFLETCTKVLHDYATTAPAGFLMSKTYQGHETELARLSGARMVVCSEVNDDDRFDEARVKQLTGGDTITARFIQQDHFSFTPTHQLWAMGNHQPHVRAGGPSFWRRLRLIPFLHSVPEDQVIDDLQGILAAQHGPAILHWIIEGAVSYARVGLAAPGSVMAATDAYERDQDTVTRFLEEMCHVGGHGHVQTKVTIVRSAYEAWCRESGDTPVSAKALGLALQRHGIGSVRSNAARMYDGIAMITAPDDDRVQP